MDEMICICIVIFLLILIVLDLSLVDIGIKRRFVIRISKISLELSIVWSVFYIFVSGCIFYLWRRTVYEYFMATHVTAIEYILAILISSIPILLYLSFCILMKSVMHRLRRNDKPQICNLGKRRN